MRVQELGGEVVEGKSPVPGIGWYARCRDTEGNDFSLFESDQSAEGAERIGHGRNGHGRGSDPGTRLERPRPGV